MVLVCGASGKVGGALVEILHSRGTRFKALSRDPRAARFPPGVETVAGDLGKRDTLSEAFRGVERIFFMGPAAELPRYAANVAAAAQAAGVQQIVMLSSLSVELPQDNPTSVEHFEAEQAIIASGCAWTMLRAGVFASNTLLWADSVRSASEVRCELLDLPYTPIHPGDIAAAAAEALEGAGHAGKAYGLTGDDAITPQDQTRILATLLGRPIRFVQLDEAAAIEIFARFYPTAEKAAELVRLLRLPDLPWNEPRPDTRRLIGRPTRSYREWAATNIALFGG
jgi:uncharacterized protein YbjT (DUF2867 family)